MQRRDRRQIAGDAESEHGAGAALQVARKILASHAGARNLADRRGADDESEMGVYHDLFQPQREANLRTRLDEFTPAGMTAGLFFAD